MSYADKLLSYIVEELLLDDEDELLGVDDELLVSERIDSLGLMRLIAHIGEELGITVPYEDILIENFRTVRTIDAYLASRPAEPNP